MTNPINDTLFQGKNKKKMRILQMVQLYLISVVLEVFESFSFNRSFVFHLLVAGTLGTAILAHTIKVSYLRITQGTQCQQEQK